ncbi:MAG: hypothetical protein L0H83_03540 [Salinisphaera sp.]|nr:hypothetical protein [Salinisphaera sp.]
MNKRILLASLLVLGFSGPAVAQLPELSGLGPDAVFVLINNVDDTVNGLVGGLGASGILALEGNVSGSAAAFTNTLTGVFINLSAGTPGAALADLGVDLGNTLVDAGAPLLSALDGPAAQLAAAGTPLTEPLIAAIQGFTFDLHLNVTPVELPGLNGLPISGLGGDSLSSLPGLPDLGGLLAILPLPGL